MGQGRISGIAEAQTEADREHEANLLDMETAIHLADAPRDAMAELASIVADIASEATMTMAARNDAANHLLMRSLPPAHARTFKAALHRRKGDTI
jgi:hypothetical protein